MCGRFQLVPEQQPAMDKGWSWVEDWSGFANSYNYAPRQQIPILLGNGGYRQRNACWRFPTPGRQQGSWQINARVETAAEKPFFAEAWRHRRCLVLATGYYEWLPVAGRSLGRRPFLLQPQGASLFCMAGLWQPMVDAAEEMACCILTTEATSSLHWLHPRMPVVFDDVVAMQAWLESAAIQPYRGDWQWRQVSSFLNKVGNDGARCVESETLWETNNGG